MKIYLPVQGAQLKPMFVGLRGYTYYTQIDQWKQKLQKHKHTKLLPSRTWSTPCKNWKIPFMVRMRENGKIENFGCTRQKRRIVARLCACIRSFLILKCKPKGIWPAGVREGKGNYAPITTLLRTERMLTLGSNTYRSVTRSKTREKKERFNEVDTEMEVGERK